MTESRLQLIAQSKDESALTFEALFAICRFLDPISLYYLSLSNKLLLQIARVDLLWDAHLKLHFPKIDVPPSNNYQLFSQTMKDKHPEFDRSKRECFVLVKENKLDLVKNKITFTQALLTETDADGNLLYSFVRKNSPEYRRYVFKQLVENETLSGRLIDPLLWTVGLGLPKRLKRLLHKAALSQINALSKYNLTHLYHAVEHNLIDCARLLLENGADPNLGHIPPLYRAAEFNKLDMLQLLCSFQANIEIKFRNQFTPLYVATDFGHLDSVKYLVSVGANVNARNENDATALLVAVTKEQTEIVRFLLEKNADANLTGYGCTLLSIACEKGPLEMVKLLLAKGANINGRNANGETALVIAVAKEQTEIVRFLLEKNADVTLGNIGCTPLCIASSKKSLEIVKLLLTHYSIMQMNNNADDLDISLYVAAKNGDAGVCRLLLLYITNPNKKYGGKSLLFIAAENGHHDIVQMLCEHNNINYNDTCIDGLTPLCIAVKNSNIKIIRILLTKGENINFQNNLGRTPLYFAVEDKNLPITTFLLENKANPDSRIDFNNGYTVLHFACLQKMLIQSIYIIQALVSAGANAQIKSYTNETPSAVAANPIIKALMKMLETVPKSRMKEIMTGECFEFAITIFAELDNVKSTKKEIVIKKTLEILQSSGRDKHKLLCLEQAIIEIYYLRRITENVCLSLFCGKDTELADALEEFIFTKMKYNVPHFIANHTRIPDITTLFQVAQNSMHNPG